MSTKKEISQFVRGQDIGKFKTGRSFRENVSEDGNISRSALGKIIAKWK